MKIYKGSCLHSKPLKVFKMQTGVLLLLCAIVGSLTCLLYCLTKRRIWNTAKHLPGPRTYPLVGNALMFSLNMNETHKTLVALLKQYGSVVRVWFGPELYIFMSDPQDIQMILGDSKFKNKDKIMSKTVGRIFGDGLLSLRGDKWQSHRKLIAPAFHIKILETYVETFARKSEILMENLRNVEHKTVNIYDQISMCTIDAICETAFGQPVNTQSSGKNAMLANFYDTLGYIERRFIRPWLWNDTLYELSSDGRQSKRITQEFHAFSEDIIAKKLEEYRCGIRAPSLTTAGNKKLTSFLDMLVEASETQGTLLSPADIRDEVTHMTIAGFETTASSMSFFLVLVALNPKDQAEIHRELDQVFGDDTRPASWDDIQNLLVLHRCIKETLRFFPIIPIIPREINEDVKLPSGYTIPGGSTAFIFNQSTHMNERYYPEPERFWPDRWLPENVVNAVPYSYLPFSAGSRNCLGQKYAIIQMKSVLSRILREYTVTTPLTMELLMRSINLSISLGIDKTVGYQVQLNKREVIQKRRSKSVFLSR